MRETTSFNWAMFSIMLFCLLTLSACSQEISEKQLLKAKKQKLKIAGAKAKITNKQGKAIQKGKAKKMNRQLATFGGGCFWCVETVFQRLQGVEKVVSGYCGGNVDNPTYHQVCSGTTGHAEVIQITYAPDKIAFHDLLEVFWNSHDPTTLNRQGNDIGTQYRSVVYYHDQEQKRITEQYKKELDKTGVWKNPIVTEISPIPEKFYPAEDYHQNYYNLNPNQGYCAYVIRPKVAKFTALFKDQLKK